MNIELLTVPGCPNRAETLARLRAALTLAGTSDVIVHEQVIESTVEAATAGLRGSPTILVDGRDPFADESVETSMSCRLYRSIDGVEGAPSVDALVEALMGDRR